MSAVVCGKRSYFDEIPAPNSGSSSPPSAKKLRCSSSTSPVRFPVSPPPPSPSPSLIDQLRAQFPDFDTELLEKALEECGYNLDAANKCLNEMRLGLAQGKSCGNVEVNANMQSGAWPTNGVVMPTEDHTVQGNIPIDGVHWVDMFVREMMSATSIDDARARASRLLVALEKTICVQAGAEAAQNIQKENMMLKEQAEGLLRENGILKRAVAIQHERQKELDDKNQEVQQLKQLVTQYQEQLRTLQVNNYALKLHLQQAQQSNSMPGHFHPDIF
ncbi:uncharacterized protein LOC116006878 [Ipomoea triloba]|uniref:uncharacterized protein LOC116006878 n=1 Tax=Ipomoea triloba TaxID=35885 RepID=UPI00125E31D4|nr:uncharacterized protein LOC116006878 [Ipomoea triloba]